MIATITIIAALYLIIGIVVFFHNVRSVRRRIGKVYPSQYFWNGLAALFWLPIGVYLAYAFLTYRK